MDDGSLKSNNSLPTNVFVTFTSTACVSYAVIQSRIVFMPALAGCMPQLFVILRVTLVITK